VLRILIAALVPALLSLAAQASELVRLDVDRQDDAYTVHVEMLYNTPPGQLRAILTDYANLDRLNTSITDSRILGMNPDGTLRVLTRFEHCVLLYCVELQKVEDIAEDEQGRIRVVMVPDASSFRSGIALWDIQREGSGSRVVLHAQLVPDLQLPAWLGAGLVKNALRRQIRDSFDSLDILVNEAAQTQHSTALDRTVDEIRRDG
jgi:hypothetical protein